MGFIVLFHPTVGQFIEGLLSGKGWYALFGRMMTSLGTSVQVFAEIINLFEDFLLVKFLDIFFANH